MCPVTLLVLFVPAFAEPTTEAETARMVRQLGAPSFAEREAATRALRSLGEKALPALRRASASSDPEARRRATLLLRPLEEKVRSREIEEIKKSKLTPEEKGQRLKAFITEGMTKQQVVTMLGQADSSDFSWGESMNLACLKYRSYDLRIEIMRNKYDWGWTPWQVKDITSLDLCLPSRSAGLGWHWR